MSKNEVNGNAEEKIIKEAEKKTVKAKKDVYKRQALRLWLL